MSLVTMRTVIEMANRASQSRGGPQAATAEELRAVVAMNAKALGDLEPCVGVETPKGFPGKYPVITAGALSRRKSGTWLIKGVLPKADIGVLFGPSGSGKSFLALDIAAAIARGVAWRGRRVRAGRVIVIVAEGGGGAGSRMKAYAKHHNLDPDTLNVGVIMAAPHFLDASEITQVTASVTAAGGAELLIVDTFAQVTPGADENSGRDMGLALSNAKNLSEATGALVLLIHHTGKDATRGARGWSGIKAAADTEIEVIKHENGVREMRISKMKDGEEGKSFAFKLKPVELGFDDDGDPITSCVVEPVEDFVSSKIEKTRPRGGNQHLVAKTARELGAHSAKGADRPAVLDRAARLMERGAGKRDQRKNYAVRALNALLDKKVFVSHEGRLYSPEGAPPPSERAVN